jgi:hypothetical protein
MSWPGRGATVGGLDTFDDLLDRWVDAEARGDATALDALLDAEFRGDGPRGFVLTKPEWLDRYRSGDLVNGAFEWQDARVRIQGNAVVVTGIQCQRASYRGEDWSGWFRATLVAVRDNGRWSIVNLQLSGPIDGSSARGRTKDRPGG